jgi:hypothetical protein
MRVNSTRQQFLHPPTTACMPACARAQRAACSYFACSSLPFPDGHRATSQPLQHDSVDAVARSTSAVFRNEGSCARSRPTGGRDP